MNVPKPRKLSSGTWFIQLRLSGESISVTAPTEKECIKEAEYIKAEHRAGKRLPKIAAEKKLPALGEAIDSYIAARKNILSPPTIRGYKGIRNNRFTAQMERSLSDITPSEWVQICNAELAICGEKTLVNAWYFICSVIRDATGNEPPRVHMPQIPRNEKLFLDHEQIQVFVKAAVGDRVEIPALLALSSLRRSEICALDWKDINLKKGTITVRSALVFNSDNKLVHKNQTKNKSSARVIPIMIPTLREALNAVEKKEGKVVTCHPNTIVDWVNRLCASAGLPLVGTHGLRHSFASLAYHLNVPEKIAMQIGGWADDKTMRKIYTHIAESDVEHYKTELTDFFNNTHENANKNAN